MPAGVIDYKIDEDFDKNEKFYFFVLFSPKFVFLAEQAAEVLGEKFNKKFVPIHIVSIGLNNFYAKGNHIILNKSLARRKTRDKRIVEQLYDEDLNVEFAGNTLIKKIVRKLINKQGRVFVYSFSSSGLRSEGGLVVLGPKSNVVERYDSKVEQMKLFKKLKLPIIKRVEIPSIQQLKKNHPNLPFLVSSTFSSGGAESRVIRCKEDIMDFCKSLRMINRKNPLIIAPYIDVVISPNSTAMVCGKNDTRILSVSDQILDDVKYLGNAYPSRVDNRNLQSIFEMMKKIGDFLSRQGYRGLFGCDFIIDKRGDCYVVDLNPRRQGGYLMNFLMSRKFNLIDLEFKLALGEKIPKFSYEDFQKNIAWMHMKLITKKPGVLTKEFKRNSELFPFEKIGSNFCSIFCPAGSILDEEVTYGYYIATGYDRDDLLRKSRKRLNTVELGILDDCA